MTAARILRDGALTALALGLAVLAWGSAMDRAARASPALARVVPEPLRANAWRIETARALERRSPTATALAERAVAADPVDPASASLLGAARFTGGDGPGAAAAFRVAGTLGWRNQPTQLYWLVAALQARDYAVATERLDALLRQAPNYPQGAVLLGQLGATPGGRAALARRLAEPSAWRHVYLGTFEGVSADQLADRALVLEQTVLARAGIGCDEIGPLAGALYAQDRAIEARRLWRSRCGAHDALLADGGFDAARLDDTSPFAWQFPGEGGLDLRLEPQTVGGGQALVVASVLPTRRIVTSQALQLEPGRYRLTWRAHDAGGSASARVAARLTCRRGEGAWLEAAPKADAVRGAAITVEPRCPLQWLELALDPGNGAVTLDDVRIARER